MAERKLLQVRLTPDARDGIAALAERYGLTVTAMLEAIGRRHRSTTLPRDLVAEARRIDAERASRRSE